ncbi:MAG: L,D-transpeptidase family protein [Gammaproteobacteria bacterium]|nr:L,D-transpeptidase family protein [Gammaproteobacteria bacterium]
MRNQKRLFMQLGTLLITSFFVLFSPNIFADEIYNQETTSTSIPTKDAMVSRLQAVLALYQDAVTHPWPLVPDTGNLLKLGSNNDAVTLLRERLIRSHDLPISDHLSRTFDHPLADAVKLFQARHGLTVDGVVGNDTLNQLNVPADMRVKQILLNMQRWADLSHRLGHRYVLVNIPEYRLHLVDNDKEVLTIRAIVGKTDWPTPELSSTITRIVFNPHWSVPRMIAQNDIVPKMIENPSYLNDNNIRIFNSEEEGSGEISSDEVDWQGAEENGFHYHLRQDPGDKNALGLVKFEFQNSQDVYLHDTPVKSLFSQDKRDLSHGCVRLEKPFDLVAYLIQNDTRMDDGKVKDIIDTHRTNYFRIKNPIPIYLTYVTAWVDDTGVVNFRDDIYHLDN